MTKRFGFRGTVFALVFLLAGCAGGGEDVKEKLGLKAPPPDEFSVVTRAPLSVPPDFTLRPPRPGEEGPNDVSARAQTKKVVFGEKADTVKAKKSSGEDSFLNKLGASEADPNIRADVDTQMQQLDEKEQPAAQKLLFWKDKKVLGKQLDPVEEQKRIAAEKKAANEPETVTIEKRNEDILKTP